VPDVGAHGGAYLDAVEVFTAVFSEAFSALAVCFLLESLFSLEAAVVLASEQARTGVAKASTVRAAAMRIRFFFMAALLLRVGSGT
jgi:hypothetical protein